jgi:hypothetical protein
MIPHLFAYFFAGAFLTNAIPHFVRGLMGQSFQSPFAKPPGKGLSSSTTNVIWGFVNFVIFYFLLFRIGSFDPRYTPHIATFGAGIFLCAIFTAHNFGKFHGGNNPTESQSE